MTTLGAGRWTLRDAALLERDPPADYVILSVDGDGEHGVWAPVDGAAEAPVVVATTTSALLLLVRDPDGPLHLPVDTPITHDGTGWWFDRWFLPDGPAVVRIRWSHPDGSSGGDDIIVHRGLPARAARLAWEAASRRPAGATAGHAWPDSVMVRGGLVAVDAAIRFVLT